MQVVIWSNSHKEINECVEKYYLSMHSFSFYGPYILEREHWRQSKILLLESNVLHCHLKITMADLRKVGLNNERMTFQRT